MINHMIKAILLFLVSCQKENIMNDKANNLQAGGWSQSGNLITADPTTGVVLQADFSKSPFGSGNYTIQFDVHPPQPDFVVRPEADISWTVNGNTVRRIVSVTDGLSITGQAEHAKVRLYDSFLAGNVPPAVAGQSYVGSINIAPGVRASQQQPPTLVPQVFIDSAGAEHFTLGPIAIPATDFVQINVPQNSGIISTFITGAIAGGGIITAAGYMATQQSPVGDLKSYFPIGEGWVAMHPGCTRITLFNFSAGPIIGGVVFGVDG